MADLLTDYQPKHGFPDGTTTGYVELFVRRMRVVTNLGTDNPAGKWFNESYVGRHSVDHSTSQRSAANPQELS